MPAKRRTKRKQAKTGGSIKGSLGKVLQRLNKKLSSVPRASHFRYGNPKAPKKDTRWLPMPQVVQTPYGLVNVNPPKPTKTPTPKRSEPYLPMPTQPAPIRKKRGGNLGLAKWGIGMIPDVYNLARSGVGSQGGNSAGSRAAYTRYGPPLLSRYR